MTLPRRLVPLVVCVMLFVSARSASAQNLLTNPTFDTDLSGWSTVTFTLAFDSTAGSPSPGSAHWTDTVGSNLSVFSGIGQCVPVTVGTTYDYSARVLINSAPAGGGARVGIIMYSDPACPAPSSQGSDISATVVTALNSWGGTSGQFTAPAGTAGIRIEGALLTGPTGGAFDVNLDSIFFGPSQQVPALDSSWLAICAAGLAGAGAMLLRRRRLA